MWPGVRPPSETDFEVASCDPELGPLRARAQEAPSSASQRKRVSGVSLACVTPAPSLPGPTPYWPAWLSHRPTQPQRWRADLCAERGQRVRASDAIPGVSSQPTMPAPFPSSLTIPSLPLVVPDPSPWAHKLLGDSWALARAAQQPPLRARPALCPHLDSAPPTHAPPTHTAPCGAHGETQSQKQPHAGCSSSLPTGCCSAWGFPWGREPVTGGTSVCPGRCQLRWPMAPLGELCL